MLDCCMNSSPSCIVPCMDNSELTDSRVLVHLLPHLQAGNKGTENSPEVKVLGVPADKKLNVSQPRALEAQKAQFILG